MRRQATDWEKALVKSMSDKGLSSKTYKELLKQFNKLWKILKEMGIPDHLKSLLRNLYVGQEATVRTGHRTTDWFQIGKGAMSRLHIVTLLI